MDLTQKRYWASTLQFIELQKLPACRKMIIFHDTAKQVMPNHSWTQSRMLERATAYAVSHPCTSNQSWSENELSPNERNPKTVCSNFASRTNPNEIIWNPENPNEPERKYLFNDFSQFSFAATKHNLLVDITEKLLLKVFIHPWIDWLTVCFILSAIRYPPGDQFIGSGLMEPIFAPLQA